METLDPPRLRAVQMTKLGRLLRWAYERSDFYRAKFDQAGVQVEAIRSLDDLSRLPLTDKAEWLKAQGDDGFGRTAALPESEIIRYHQSSGTSGQPIRLGFSHRDWLFWQQCWGYGLAACGLKQLDRVLVCFPFNLFVGWWGGQDAARLLGSNVYPGGGMSSRERAAIVRDHGITVLMGAPSYLLRLAEVAERELSLQARELRVRKLVCGAEPGGSIPSTRKRLEEAWGAEVFDHLGASEVGPWGYECSAHPGGVHICESLFLVEMLDPSSLSPAAPGQLARLVVTSLEKRTQPVIRWDLKDLVRVSEDPCTCGRTFRWVKGGILGRTDDLIKVKGVLFSPQTVEDVVRSFPQLKEFRIELTRNGAIDELTLKAETSLSRSGAEGMVEELRTALRDRTHLRFEIEFCSPGAIPNLEVKTRRMIDLRKAGAPND